MMVRPPQHQSSRRAYINAQVHTPAGPVAGGVLIDGGWILAAGKDVTRANAGNGAEVIDCGGNHLLPGLTDMR
jgi:predicted amidohydrolase YtcJ